MPKAEAANTLDRQCKYIPLPTAARSNTSQAHSERFYISGTAAAEHKTEGLPRQSNRRYTPPKQLQHTRKASAVFPDVIREPRKRIHQKRYPHAQYMRHKIHLVISCILIDEKKRARHTEQRHRAVQKFAHKHAGKRQRFIYVHNAKRVYRNNHDHRDTAQKVVIFKTGFHLRTNPALL